MMARALASAFPGLFAVAGGEMEAGKAEPGVGLEQSKANPGAEDEGLVEFGAHVVAVASDETQLGECEPAARGRLLNLPCLPQPVHCPP